MKEEADSYGHVLKYTGVFGGVQGLNIVVNLVRNKLVSIILGPEGMGLVSLFNSTVNFISQTTNMGLSASAIKHISEVFDSGDEKRIAHFVKVVRLWSLLVALLGMVVCIIAGPLLSNYTFSWGDHTLHFILLSPAVGLLAITLGETAILKAARALRALAVVQIYTVMAALLISVPIYKMLGQTGIVPVIVLLALVSMLLTVRYSYRIVPLELKGAHGLLGEGMGMVRLGLSFMLAGIMGSGAEMLIRSYLNVNGSLEEVGLYSAGFMLTITYASIVFSSMESDYFPRISAISGNNQALCLSVNRQIEVSLLIVAPMLAGLIVALPVLVPLLLTSKFLPMVPMAQVAVFSMYIKSVSLPISYLTLAKGDSVAYMTLEAIYDLVMVAAVLLGYTWGGLFGIGVGLSVSYLVDVLIVYFYTHRYYDYTMSSSVMKYAAIHLSLGVAAYLTTYIGSPVLYWLLGMSACAASLIISVYILHQKTSLWTALTEKLTSKFRRHG